MFYLLSTSTLLKSHKHVLAKQTSKKAILNLKVKNLNLNLIKYFEHQSSIAEWLEPAPINSRVPDLNPAQALFPVLTVASYQ